MQKIAIIIGILIGIAAAISVTGKQQAVPPTGEAFQAFKLTVSTIVAYDKPEAAADNVKLVNGKGEDGASGKHSIQPRLSADPVRQPAHEYPDVIPLILLKMALKYTDCQ